MLKGTTCKLRIQAQLNTLFIPIIEHWKVLRSYTFVVLLAPHQPRLDWQMWFAALGSYQHNTWFVHLIYRLLTGQREVLDLIQHNPFPDKPPKFIRAKLYHYHFTGQTKKDKWYALWMFKMSKTFTVVQKQV